MAETLDSKVSAMMEINFMATRLRQAITDKK